MAVRNALLGLLLAATLAGCEGKPVALVAVNGRVTYAGSALVGGVIVFTPEEESGTHGGCSIGDIGTDGRYTLSTEGAPAWRRAGTASPSPDSDPVTGQGCRNDSAIPISRNCVSKSWPVATTRSISNSKARSILFRRDQRERFTSLYSRLTLSIRAW